MKPIHTLTLATAVAALITLALRADTLSLRNGQIIEGTYVGGSSGNISFNTAQGTVSYPTSQVITLTFSQSPPPPAPAQPMPPPVAVQPTPPPTGDITVPAGTVLLVRMQQQVTSDNEAGTTFVGTLESDLVTTNGARIAPAGTKVYGVVTKSERARRLFGHAELELALNQILIDNIATPIMTGNFTEAAAGAGAKTVGATGVGAGIGAIADGSEGARTGAAIGLGVAVLKRGDSVIVPPNAVLQFQLSNSLTVRLGQ